MATIDPLGITDKENLQIDALSLGASPLEVASLSRQSIDQIPKLHERSEFDAGSSIADDAPSEFEETLRVRSSRHAAKDSIPAAILSGDETGKDYIGMYDQFTTTGTSSIFDRVKQELRDRESRELDEFIEQTATLGDVSGTQALLEAREPLLEEGSNVRVKGLEKAAESFLERNMTESVIDAQRKFFQENRETSRINDSINEIIDAQLRSNSSDLDDYFGNALEQGFVGEQIFALSNVGKEILGESYNFQAGTMMRDLAQHLRSTPLDQREAEASRIVDSITKNSSGLGREKNDVIRTFALEQFRQFASTPGGDIVFDRWLANVIGYSEISNFVSAGLLTKVLRKVGKILKSTSSLAKVETVSAGLARANPDFDAALKAAAISSDADATRLGTTVSDVVQKAMPGRALGDDTILEGAPNSLIDKLELTRTKAKEAEEFLDNTFLYAPEDYAQKQKRIQSILDNEKFNARVKPSFSTFDVDPNGNNLIVKAIYGDDSDLPLSLAKAFKIKSKVEEAMIAEGIQNPNATILAKDRITKTYEPYDPRVHDRSKTDFLVSIDTKAKLGYNDIAPGQLLGEGATKGIGTITGQKVASYLNDPQSYINSRLLGAARVANDQKHLKAHQLLSIAKPFLSLNWFGKKRVANLLEVGEQEKRVLKFSELKGKYSNEEIEAYYSTRYLNDTVYNIKNADLRADLHGRGFKNFVINEGKENAFINAARVVSPQERGKVKVVFDPETGQKIQLTENILNSLDENSVQVVKLLRPVDMGNESISFALAKSEQLTELPRNVLAHSPGYNFRINKDPYFIDKVERKVVDGEVVPSHRTTIGVAKTKEEADSWVKELLTKEGKNGVRFQTRIDRNINSVDSALENDIDLLEGSGTQFYFSRRGDRLQRRDGTDSAIEDPITAINRMVASVANVKTHADLLETSVIRHRQTYGEIVVDGKKLWAFDPQKNDFHFDKALAQRAQSRPKVAAAIAEYNYLEQLKYSPTAVDKAWKDVLEGIDAFAASGPTIVPFGLGAKARTAAIKALASTTPGRVTRGAAFALTIPLRPLRHLVLQASTGLSLSGIDPISTARAFRDSPLMMISMATWQNPTLWKQTKASAALFGYKPDEWEEMFNAFKASGKPFSIDSHVAVGEANFSWARSMPDTIVGEAGRQLLNVAKSPITVGKAIGFDTGELANQAVTWRFAVDRWKKKNPGQNPFKSKRAIDEINDQARAWSIDMTRTNATGYQTGAFASMTQFMSINHKMLFRMLGKDPNIKGWTQAKYIAGMLAMYGAAGVGMQDFYDSWVKSTGVELPPEVDDALYGGFTQALFNKSLDLAFGNERGSTRTALADSFSPASGVATFVPEFAANIVDMNVAELLAGPSGSVIPNIHKAANYSLDMWGRDDLTDGQKFIKSLDAASREFGSFSDYFKFNLAMAYKEKSDELFIVGKDGRPSLHANSAQEVWTKMLLGLNTRGEQELYNKYLDMYQKVNSSGKANKAQIDKDAEHLVKYMYEVWAESSDPFEFAEKIKPITFALHKADRMYGVKVQREALKRFSMNPKFELFVTQIIQNFSLLDANSDFNSMKNAVRNSDAMRDDQKQTMIDAIEAMELSSEAGRELIDTVTK